MAGRSQAEARAFAPEPGWRCAAASVRGEGHARRGERRQDFARVIVAHGVLIAAAADGAGSAPRGGAGAALAVRTVAAEACAALAGRPLAALDADAVEGWMRAARDRIAAAAGDRPLRDFATTLSLAVSDGAATLIGHVGDGAIVGRGPEGWRALSWPEAGEEAGATYFLTDDAPSLRAARIDAPLDALALLTDGIERLVLDFAARAPHAPFFERMAAPLDACAAPGRDAALSRALGAYLAGPGFAARTDDDRTLIVAARR